MTMQPRSYSEVPGQGKVIVIYSLAGAGKTTSCFETLPEPMLCIKTEPRNPVISIKASKRLERNPKARIDIVEYTNWDEIMEFVNTPDNFKIYKSVMVDSASYLMNIHLSNEVEDQSFEAKEEKEKEIRPIVTRTKLSLPDYGGLASQMSRFMKAMGRLSENSKYVVITALLQESPKWDRDLYAAPAFKGKEFVTNLPGYCDLIGMVEPRYEEKKKGDIVQVFPPMVSFEGEGFMCKFTGVRNFPGRARGPLDFRKILGVIDIDDKKEEKKK